MTHRIGIDFRYVGAESSGQQRYLWRLAHHLAERGHEVTALTVYESEPRPSQHDRVDVVSLTDMSRKDRVQAFGRLALDTCLANPERAHRYVGVSIPVLRPGYGTRQGRQRLTSLSPGLQLTGYKLLRRMPWVRARMRAEAHWYGQSPPPLVVVNSEITKAFVQGDYDVSDDRIRMVRNGVPLDQFNPAARAELRQRARTRWGYAHDDVVLGFVGHNFRLKGLWETYQAVAHLQRHGRTLRLLAAGKGTGSRQVAEAKSRIEQMGLGATVTMVGAVEDPRWVYAASDGLVFPSWHDSFGFVILEAAAMGVPVLTTRLTGASELLTHGQDALLIDRPNDSEALRAAVAQLLEPATRRRLGESAARLASGHGEEASLDALADVLEESVAENRLRAN